MCLVLLKCCTVCESEFGTFLISCIVVGITLCEKIFIYFSLLINRVLRIYAGRQ